MEQPFLIETAVNRDAIEFAAPASGVYAVAETTKEMTLTASDGNRYRVTVTYGDAARIPLDAELKVASKNSGTTG